MRKIAILLPNFRPGGVERMRVELSKVWLGRGYKVDFVVLEKKGALIEYVPTGADIHDLGVRRYRSAVQPLLNYLAREQPDVVLAAMWPLTIVGILATKLSRRKVTVVVSDHNTLSKALAKRGLIHHLALRLSMRTIYPFALARLAVSRGVARDLSELSGLRPDQFTVVYNPAAYRSDGIGAAGRRPAELSKTAKIILSVGTLKHQKDHEFLIDAFALLPTDLDVQLCILGEGDLRPLLEQAVARNGLTGKVVLPGFRVDTTPYYEAADLFALSSRYEGFGNVIVEALERGLPVVSTDCPSGPREILCDGKFGRLVRLGDTAGYALAMAQSLHETRDEEVLKSRARDFSVDKIADEYLDVLFPAESHIG